jgi:class 3 adenylate cyclase/tetratricopeptide (TPR) repeat protein
MTKCSACGTENRSGRRFCAHCGAALEARCPACAAANDPGDRFCGECGTALGAAAAPPAGTTAPAAAIAERRLVCVLFADLVGFTTLSEHRDPEEVRELLSRYFERCRTLIERYGGTVEKFIGDAVMAVWGTPVAREDDAERAVRAALALSPAVTALGEEVGVPELRVRAGVLTGGASVEVGGDGEGMVLGDTVNTASRLQSIAEPGTVLVDDTTRRASEAAIAYEDAGTHQVKGRDQPVHTWTALSVVAGAAGARRGVGLEAPFVGREMELQLVIDALEDSVSRGAARLVTVTGDAGTGKSRLLWELFKYVDGIEDVRYWHQGRCPSYGEGVAYWALAEMIRARAGIAEDEDPSSARAKLEAEVDRFVSDERERRLVEPRLAHLLGLEQRTASEPADLFSGWRLFFERMAATEPVILVFEDVQWADSGLLDFIDYLLEWSADHPLFILVLGRPELEARRPDWGTATRLDPLPPAAMQALLANLVPGLPPDLATRILKRAEGVPLYAVETVRMLLDRGLLTQEGQRYVVAGTIADLEVPETLHQLVAARLDNLEAPERALLQDAAVLGESFTPAALAAVTERPEAEVRRRLDALVAKQVLGHDDDLRSAEPGQYRFLQALVRTIAVGTLSRRDRKARHLAAAEYLRSTSGEATEIVEVLASHYLDAVAADPEAADVEEIRAKALQTLETAGHRASSLALAAEARRYFEQAAGLAAEETERAALLAEAGAAAARSADNEGARALLTDAISVFDAGDRSEDAGRTRAMLADVLIAENRLEDAAQLMDRARESLVDEAVLAGVASRRARVAFLMGDFDLARREADAALAIADPCHLWPVLAEALLTKGPALYYDHRHTEAGALMELGLRIALEENLTEPALRGYFNLADYRVIEGRAEGAAQAMERGLALARERGNRAWERDLLAQTVQIDGLRGEWDHALSVHSELRLGGDDESLRAAEIPLPMILAARGQTHELEAWLARPVMASEWRELALLDEVGRAIALRATGNLPDAVRVLTAVAPEYMTLHSASSMVFVADVVDILLEGEQVALLEELLAPTAHIVVPLIASQLACARGLLLARRGDTRAAEAALADGLRLLRPTGAPYMLARGLLAHGPVLFALGRDDEAAKVLHEARSIFAQLGATPWIERVDGVRSAATVA